MDVSDLDGPWLRAIQDFSAADAGHPQSWTTSQLLAYTALCIKFERFQPDESTHLAPYEQQTANELQLRLDGQTERNQFARYVALATRPKDSRRPLRRSEELISEEYESRLRSYIGTNDKRMDTEDSDDRSDRSDESSDDLPLDAYGETSLADVAEDIARYGTVAEVPTDDHYYEAVSRALERGSHDHDSHDHDSHDHEGH